MVIDGGQTAYPMLLTSIRCTLYVTSHTYQRRSRCVPNAKSRQEIDGEQGKTLLLEGADLSCMINDSTGKFCPDIIPGCVVLERHTRQGRLARVALAASGRTKGGIALFQKHDRRAAVRTRFSFPSRPYPRCTIFCLRHGVLRLFLSPFRRMQDDRTKFPTGVINRHIQRLASFHAPHAYLACFIP